MNEKKKKNESKKMHKIALNKKRICEHMFKREKPIEQRKFCVTCSRGTCLSVKE